MTGSIQDDGRILTTSLAVVIQYCRYYRTTNGWTDGRTDGIAVPALHYVYRFAYTVAHWECYTCWYMHLQTSTRAVHYRVRSRSFCSVSHKLPFWNKNSRCRKMIACSPVQSIFREGLSYWTKLKCVSCEDVSTVFQTKQESQLSLTDRASAGAL